MPELAEVEYYRRQWTPGLGEKITRVQLHAAKRIFRGIDPETFVRRISGAILRESESHGKQMLFRFSPAAWLGVHLGMTGKLRVEPPHFTPGKHDHLALGQRRRTLVFSDPRLFGRIRFHAGSDVPDWWAQRAHSVLSGGFTLGYLAAFLRRHGRAPIKAVLLLQNGFPGIGNWMADEILWQASLHPALPAGALRPAGIKRLHQATRFVARTAMRRITRKMDDLPDDWLFNERWRKRGNCPRDQSPLKRTTIGGRTTVFCPRCQGKTPARHPQE